jgi:hypothetical protein
MNRNVIRSHINTVSILVFTVLFFLVQMMKPSIIYDKDGSLRVFGLGSKKKTILPIWLISIILALLYKRSKNSLKFL